MISPWLVGQISQHYSLQVGLLVPVFSLFLIMVLQTILTRERSDQKIFRAKS